MLFYPDYDNGIINVISSIRKYYRTRTAYPSLRELDRCLDSFYKNVILISLNGLGRDMLENTLERAALMRSRYMCSLTSVFPTSRTPAYISMLTGLSPNEHGWLGHNLFFKEFCRTVSVFGNYDSYSRQSVANPNVAEFIMPHEVIFSDIKNSVIAHVQPFSISQTNYPIPENGNYHKTADTQKKLFDLMSLICETKQHTFTFVQWNEIAEQSRLRGCYSDEVYDILRAFENNLNEFCAKTQDTIIIITSGHGMVDVSEEVQLHLRRDLTECMIMPPDIEGRAMSFFLKPDKRGQFYRIFSDSFGNDFTLIPSSEVMRKGLYGRGKTHPKISDFMGDYMACGISDKTLRFRALNEKPKNPPKAASGGLTDEEMIVPLIVLSTKQTLKYRPPRLEDITPNIKYF